MIKSLKLINFLSHRKSLLEFSPGVNVIVGESDAGKSALIHAIRWVMDNRPLGDSYRSNWGGLTKVVLRLDNNIVTKKKTDKEHIYKLDKLIFKAFKTSVPEEVLLTLNMSEVNLQAQLTPHFLISKSPGEVAQYFNGIAKLDQIDSSLQNINKNIGQINSKLKYDSENKILLEDSLLGFDNVGYMETIVNELERLHKSFMDNEEQIKDITGILTDLETNDLDVRSLNTLIESGKLIEEMSILSKAKIEKDLKISTLYKIIGKLEVLEDGIGTSNKLLAGENKVRELGTMCNAYDFLNESITALEKLINRSAYLDQERMEVSEEHKSWEEEFHKFKGHKCPTCGALI